MGQEIKKAQTRRKAQKEKTPTGESWYCIVCRKDVELAMAKCALCGTWVHNECVGLESEDDDPDFMCPECDE